MKPILGLLLLLLWASALACGPPSQHEIVKKADGAETKQELEQRLGAPDEIDKLGPIETWTYEASDGNVEFVITGDKIQLESTVDRDEPEDAEK